MQQKAPEDEARLDYLYKWYLWCWSFRDLTRQYPTICLPDDHDVYHGNLWGWGGRQGTERDQDGGYLMSAEFVRMVERTQTSHLPAPYDPAPIERGIGVYYGAFTYGGIGFALLEDRKFKSPPGPFSALVSDRLAQLRQQHGADFAPRKNDIPEVDILGDRQIRFLRDWVQDWRGHRLKVALSQTIFACAQTNPQGRVTQDRDTNGWPASARNQALDELRKGYVFMIGGDQHLATVIHHGIDAHRDAGYSFCVPAVANYWVRNWQPAQPGEDRAPGRPDYTGNFLDGFGNRVRIEAVARPYTIDGFRAAFPHRSQTELHRKAAGYGIVEFDKTTRAITMECWPRYAPPTDSAGQYADWPVRIRQQDNYGRQAVAYLPELTIEGVIDPVVTVREERTGELIYSLRISGQSFRPPVFTPGTYTLRAEDPDTGRFLTRTGLSARPGTDLPVRLQLQLR